ncbi:MAG: glycosyl hydrolase [Mangrovibacterium sp.]
MNFRPLRIIHNNLDSALIDKLAEYGYGGLVTNVSFENYLKSKENWEKFQKFIQYAIDRKGMRIWLYDEKGYPSGTAGGQVLAEYPEFEAQGLAVITEKENNHGEVIINHPKGHGKVIFIRAYRKAETELELDQMIDLMRFTDENGNLRWNAPKGDWIIYYLVQKPFYEATHAAHNWAEKRRYINIMEKDAANHFIASTHEKYYKHVGKYFGKGIEAFFTDEPSLLGTYFTGYDPPRTPPVLDTPDTDFKLYPTLNWSNFFLNEFTIRRGYDLYPYLPYLFSDENDKARLVRRDYYQTMTNLVAENYFEPLEKFCSRTGVASSGHLLLEENLYLHPVFEGDIMAMYRKMHFPGIDLLTAYPQKAMEWGSTAAKLASSVANYYGKRHVMSEISNAFDSDEAGIEGRIASVGVQFAYGIDIFNSYYSHDKMSKTENRQLTDYIGRVGYLLSHGKRVPQIAIYYPIESIWENTFPSMTLNPQGFDQRAVSISNNFKKLAKNLIENHIDFDYMSNSEILQCKIEGDKMITPSGGEFELLIIPMATFLPSDLLNKIEQLARNGVKIIIQDKLFLKDDMADQTNKFLRNILNHIHVQNADSLEKLVALSGEMVKPKVYLDPGNKEVMMLHKCSSSVDLYFFVNTGESRTFKVKFYSSGSHVKLWDPHTGKVCLVDIKNCGDEITTELTLEKWRSALISIEP